MNQQPPSPNQLPRIRGSWEALIEEGQRKTESHPQEAIAAYRRVVDGLSKVPEQRRLAANRRLQELLLRATYGLHGLLNVGDRYDESIELIRSAREYTSEDEQVFLDRQLVDVLVQAGRSDQAIAEARAFVDASDRTAGDWGALITTYVRLGLAHETGPIFEEMERVLAEEGKLGLDEEEPDDATSDRAYLWGLRAMVALELGDLDSGVDAFEQVLESDGAYAEHLHLLYSKLAGSGDYERALRFVDRDARHPIRAGFWRGLIHKMRGDNDKARRAWRTAADSDLAQVDSSALAEYIHARYYLGDPEGEALGLVLQALQQRPNWHLMYLAGIGWAARNDIDTARNNLRLAQTRRKAAADGLYLPEYLRRLSEPLIDEASWSELQGFFEPKGDPMDGNDTEQFDVESDTTVETTVQ